MLFSPCPHIDDNYRNVNEDEKKFLFDLIEKDFLHLYTSFVIVKNCLQSIGEFQKQFMSGDLSLSSVVSQVKYELVLSKKKYLIEEFIRGFVSPTIYLWGIGQQTLENNYPDGENKALYRAIFDKKKIEKNDPDPHIFEVFGDQHGQQLIRAILEFMGIVPFNNKCYQGNWHGSFTSLRKTPISKGKSYRQLDAKQQSKFVETTLPVIIIENATFKEIQDISLVMAPWPNKPVSRIEIGS